MKKLLFLLLLLPVLGLAQSFTFTPLSGTYQRWGVGNDNWQGQSGGQIVPNYHAPTIFYRRFTVPELVNPNGTYTFTRFNSFINAAIQNRQLFGFRIFTMYAWPECPDCHNFTPVLSGIDGRTGNNVSAMSAVPQEWHTAMQACSPRNWISESGDWVPVYNCSAFLTRFAALHEATNTNIMTGSFTPTWSATPINYRDVIAYIDVSGFGTWGEWHSYASAFNNVVTTYPGYGLTGGNDQVAGSTFPTIATLKAIIDAHKNAYDSFQLAIIINAFDNMRLPNTKIPAEVGVHAYKTRTAAGYWMGRRIDHAGDDTGYDDFYLQLNSGVFGGYEMDTAHNFRHRLAPFYGEPPGGPVYLNGINQGRLPSQARKWHWTSIGNGNWGGTSGVPTGQGADSVRLAFSIMGYHYRLTGGNANLTASNLTVNLNWQNFGLTPTYNHWTVEYSLRNGAGSTVWTSNSTFDPYLYATEQGNTTKSDTYTRPALTPGTYSLYMRAKDRRNGYMTPMQLQINGRDGNGYYFLANIVFSGGTPVNQLPTVNAGNNQSITGASTTLTAIASDPDGTISGYQWTQVGGPPGAVIGSPTSASTNISSLVAGMYTFAVTVTDDDGGTASDGVTVTRNPPVPPLANAGANQTITLPTSSTTVNGSGTDADGTIVRYEWTQVGGPSSAAIASPATASTLVSGLVSGTYSFRLTVTDNSDMAAADDMNVIVQSGNAAPVANAGSNQTITLPTNSANLSGSLSTDDNIGTVTYAWTKVGGPGTFTITSPGTVNTSVTGMIAGAYIYRLTVTDAGGLVHTDDVQVTVNAAPNGVPVANAGANQAITLPTNSVTVSSAGSTDDGPITRLWSKVSGPANFNITTPTAISTSITGLIAGVYSFRVTVTDGNNLSSFDDVQVNVNTAGNAAPVSNAGGNQSITLPVDNTSLSGALSTDDNVIAVYGWSKISGPVGGFISSSNTVNTNITSLQAGTYTYRLRVIDGGGLFDDDDVQIVVNPAFNASPVAVAGVNQTITLPTSSTTLNGSGSSDDAPGLIYAWSKISGPTSYTLATPGAASTNVTGLTAGLYTFRLSVTDVAGLIDTDDINVTVNSVPAGSNWWQFWRWIFRKR